jgi:hypothetical protein
MNKTYIIEFWRNSICIDNGADFGPTHAFIGNIYDCANIAEKYKTTYNWDDYNITELEAWIEKVNIKHAFFE